MATKIRSESARRRSPSGFRNRRVREANSLPLGWHHLTQVDIERLVDIIDAKTDRNADLRTLEGCLLLWSALVTGRHPADLLDMSVRLITKGTNLHGEQAGLISRDGKWGWWLRTASPDQKRIEQTCPTSDFVYLPATIRVTELIKRCIARRRSGAAAPINISGQAQPLFTVGKPLVEDVTKLLAARHAVSPERARRATTTPETIARWLPAELIGMPGGDVVVSGLITGSITAPGNTPSYYGAISNDAAIKQYRAAVDAVDTLSHRDLPGQLLTTHLGDHLTPTDDAVRGMIRQLGNALDNENHDLAERHRAMTRYTLALLGFAFAHRGKVENMPSVARVHKDTGFSWIADKSRAGGAPARRMVWVCAVAKEQLKLYQAHVDHICGQATPAAAAAIRGLGSNLSGPAGLVPFDLMSTKVLEVKIAAAMRDAMHPFGLRPSAGRHWLRSKLLGKCSTETLHAFYGHGPIGDGSWDASSTLDPATYRADLAGTLDPVMRGIGWMPRSVPLI